MHVTQVHPVATENQFHCTRLYTVVWRHTHAHTCTARGTCTPRVRAHTHTHTHTHIHTHAHTHAHTHTHTHTHTHIHTHTHTYTHTRVFIQWNMSFFGTPGSCRQVDCTTFRRVTCKRQELNSCFAVACSHDCSTSQCGDLAQISPTSYGLNSIGYNVQRYTIQWLTLSTWTLLQLMMAQRLK